MPELVKNGPRIPASLMNEADSGSVVFFCGAGVSAGRGSELPSFARLVKHVYDDNAMVPDGVEREALDCDEPNEELRRPAFDKALGLLERPNRVECIDTRARGNRVEWSDGEIVVRRGPETQTPAARGLENWLREQARSAIADYLPVVTARIGQEPARVYVMGQRTKWGNCSSRRNLSFNWRLILAPDFVLRYLVAHEVVHLVVPDHSAKFWSTVQSLCPDMERAKQWLSRHHAELTVSLASVM